MRNPELQSFRLSKKQQGRVMFFCKDKETCQGSRTLNDLRSGEKAVVRCVDRAHGCHVGRLASMGITQGAEVEMLSNGSGPLLVLVRSSRLCLCRSLGKAVIVQ